MDDPPAKPEAPGLPPLPSPVKLPPGLNPGPVEDLAYQLYDGIARADERQRRVEEKLNGQLAEVAQRTRRLIASLAAERFEFARLEARLRPQLEVLPDQEALQALALFARAWDLRLARAGIQVIDLRGQVLDDALAAEVEVESHFPDPAVVRTMVRETLVPLVLLDGEVIGTAKIVTAVPLEREGGTA